MRRELESMREQKKREREQIREQVKKRNKKKRERKRERKNEQKNKYGMAPVNRNPVVSEMLSDFVFGNSQNSEIEENFEEGNDNEEARSRWEKNFRQKIRSSLKWTVLRQSGLSLGFELDGPNDWN